jgi:hypothetical protein
MSKINYLDELNVNENSLTNTTNNNNSIEMNNISNDYINILQNSRIEKIWISIKKDLGQYNLCQRANLFDFIQLIEKVNE